MGCRRCDVSGRDESRGNNLSVELRNWRGKDLEALAKLTMAKRLEAAAILLQNEIKQDISEPSNKGATPSAPGEPPHKDTGRLRASISREINAEELIARVGSNLAYAKFLELGTVKMAARPFLRKAFWEHMDKLKRILEG